MTALIMIWYEPAPILVREAQRKVRAHRDGDLTGFLVDERLGDLYDQFVTAFPVDGDESIWSTPPLRSTSVLVFAVKDKQFAEAWRAACAIGQRLDLSLFNSYGRLAQPPARVDAPVLRMKTAHGSLVYEPDLGVITGLLDELSPENWFALLIRPDGWYMQVAACDDFPQWHLEFREGSGGQHFQTTVAVDKLRSLAAVFEAFGRDDFSWRSRFEWSTLDPP